MREYICPIQIRVKDGWENSGDLIIDGMMNKAQEKDFIYYAQALEKIINNYSFYKQKFKPLPESRDKDSFVEGAKKNYFKNEKLAAIILNEPENLLCFYYEGAEIYIVKIEGEYKLILWDDLYAIVKE